MNFTDLIHKRFSSRKYTNQKISGKVIEQILDAGRRAPSAVNYQPWHFIVLQETEQLQRIHTAYTRSWFKAAPVVIVICGDRSTSWKRSDGKDYTDIDIAIATDHMTLQAAELDVGSCWVCNFDKQIASNVLNLPEHIEPIVLLPLGYPQDNPEDAVKHNSRKSLQDIVHYETFKH